MSNRNKRITGIIFLLILVVVGIVVKAKSGDRGIGLTLLTLGVLGLFAQLVDWVHNLFKKPRAK
jgi:hypothetical protein